MWTIPRETVQEWLDQANMILNKIEENSKKLANIKD